MSQTIEEIILEKEQELGLNQEQLEALKDYSTKVAKLIDANKALFLVPNVLVGNAYNCTMIYIHSNARALE